MGTQSERPKSFKVVVGIDFSPASVAVFQKGLETANSYSGSELHVVTVAQYARPSLAGTDGVPEVTIPPDAVMQLQQFTERGLAAARAAGTAANIGRVVTHVLSGAPADEIVWLAANLDADAIVVGTHGRRGMRRLVLGSVAERVVRTAGCPVLVERPKQHNEAWKTPEIEPPCAECLAAREESKGAELWCKRHRDHHFHTHVYSYSGIPTERARPWGFSLE